jgi:hypothetical protein
MFGYSYEILIDKNDGRIVIDLERTMFLPGVFIIC